MAHCFIPTDRNMATIQTHHTQARAESRSYSEPLFSLDHSFHPPHLLSVLLFSPLASFLISPFLTSGAFTFLFTPAFFFCVKESLSVNQPVTHSLIHTAVVCHETFGPVSNMPTQAEQITAFREPNKKWLSYFLACRNSSPFYWLSAGQIGLWKRYRILHSI